MPRPKSSVTPIPVPADLVAAVLGNDKGTTSLGQIKTAHQDLVKAQSEIQAGLNNPVALTLARGIAGTANVKIEVTLEGELFVVPATPSKPKTVKAKTVKAKTVAKAPKAKKVTRAKRAPKKAPVVDAAAAPVVDDAAAAPVADAPKKVKKAKRAPKKVAAKGNGAAKKGNGAAKKDSNMPSFPSISELRAKAAAANVDISAIAPQNKRAILDAIENAAPPVA